VAAAKTVLLTGATGFVGANLARALLKAGHRVHLLLRSESASWRIREIEADVTTHVARLADYKETRALVKRLHPDWIFHLAAHGAYSFQTGWAEMLQTNVLGTVHLLESALEEGFEAFVHAGSSSEYGLKDHPPAEEEPLEPNSHYAVTKASATLFCKHAGLVKKAPVRVLRLYSVYGPYEEPDRLMPTLLRAASSGKWPVLVDPAVARDFVHTDDVCRAFISAAENPNQEPGAVYNVGSGRQTTIGELVDTVKKLLPIREEPKFGSMPNRAWDTTCWVSNPAKISNAIGWRAEIDLEQGLRRTLQWFSEKPELARFYDEFKR